MLVGVRSPQFNVPHRPPTPTMRPFLDDFVTYHIVQPARRMLARMTGAYSPRTIALQWPSHPVRFDFLSTLAGRKNISSYLEIGCFQDECFSRIQAPRKVGVDPVSGGTVRGTSDEFFATNGETFDLVFIDGLHLAEQVLKDVENSLRVLRPDGVIVLHDCLPLDAVAQYRQQSSVVWNGDVWKAFVEIRRWPDVDAATCLIDHGLGVVTRRPNTAPLSLPVSSYRQLTFDHLAGDYGHLLRTLDYDAALEFAIASRAPGA